MIRFIGPGVFVCLLGCATSGAPGVSSGENQKVSDSLSVKTTPMFLFTIVPYKAMVLEHLQKVRKSNLKSSKDRKDQRLKGSSSNNIIIKK